jgi:protein-disulfide isomerase
MHTLRALVLPLALVAFGCPGNRSAQTGQSAGDEVVATYAGKKLTLRELDEKISAELFELRRNQLEQIILQDIVQMEAKKLGLTEEEYLKREIEAKAPQPSEEEIQAFWQRLQAQMPPGAELEQFRSRIIQQLSGPAQQERARQLFGELREKANVEVKLQEPLPPKVEGVQAVGPSKGPENAKVTIVEFSDFQCPFCSKAAATVDEVMEQYAGKVRLVFRHFPLDFHKEAPKAHEASLCAHDQAKFWEYHDVLFKNQDQLQPEQLVKHAQGLGLDVDKFKACLGEGKHAAAVQRDLAAGKEHGVSGTPAFFVNGRMLSGARPKEDFVRLIDAELGGRK